MSGSRLTTRPRKQQGNLEVQTELFTLRRKLTIDHPTSPEIEVSIDAPSENFHTFPKPALSGMVVAVLCR